MATLSNLSNLVDLSNIEGVGLSGGSLANPMELLTRLGFSSAVIYGIQQANLDQELERILAGYLPSGVAEAVTAGVVAGASDIGGGWLRRQFNM